MKSNTNRINSLKDKGFKVKIEHYRVNTLTGEMQQHSRKLRTIASENLSGTGGATLLTIITPDDQEYKSSAFCSDIEQFNYRLGTTIALNRAILEMTS